MGVISGARLPAEAHPDEGHTVDLAAILDSARFGPVQFLVLALTFLALVMDGFDIQAIAFAAPALTKFWGIERSALGPVLAAALLGMAAGAAVIGPFGDRFGRKTALLVCCSLMAVGSLASAWADGQMELAAYRLLTGIGLGGALPNATALMFEFSPKAWRQLATSVTVVGVLLGGIVGAALARWLIPEFGWRALFAVGGVIPALLTIAMWLLLPESPRYLTGRNSRTGELAKLLNLIAGSERYGATLRVVDTAPVEESKSTIAAIFTSRYRRHTLVLWLIFFTNVFSVYFFFNWLPTVLAAANLDFRIAVTGSLVFNLGGVLGALAGSALISRYGSKSVLAAFGAVAVLSVLAIGASTVFDANSAHAHMASLMWTMTVAGCCINALQVGMYLVAAHAYPTFCRSTGVGWSLAVARFGGIISAFAGAGFFALGLTPHDFFYVIAGVLTLAFLGVLLLGAHIPATAGAADCPPSEGQDARRS